MTAITIPRALLEQALEALELVTEDYDDSAVGLEIEAIQDLRAALTATETAPAKLDPAGSDDVAEEMSAVADQYAHKLALDLECVLADYSGTWYDTAISTLGAYREAMNAIHERQSPTFMGEPVIRPALAAPATAPEQPAWHDAPEVAALKAERDAAMKDAERYRWLAAHTRISSEHWGGRWSIVIDGPVPKRNGCEDAFDEAIDAAIAKAEGGAA